LAARLMFQQPALDVKPACETAERADVVLPAASA
jgi:hypothetical protein